MTQTASRAVTTSNTRRSPSAALLVGAAIALSAGVQFAVFAIGMFVASDHDIHRSEGVKASLVSVSVVAAICLAVGFAIALATRRSASHSKVGAIALGALSVLSIPIFWAGGPAIFGGLAAWLGGLTKNGQPHWARPRVRNRRPGRRRPQRRRDPGADPRQPRNQRLRGLTAYRRPG